MIDLYGGFEDDAINVYGPDICVFAKAGNDTIYLNQSNFGSIIDGGVGIDTVVYDGPITDLFFDIDTFGLEVFIDANFHHPDANRAFLLENVEFIKTSDGIWKIPTDQLDLFSVSYGAVSYGAEKFIGHAYEGPVVGLVWEYFGTTNADIIGGTVHADFINGFAGDDAINAGAGNDVIDGGLGSNFLVGGAGIDTFFLDGRGGGVCWSTIVDWQAGEQLSLWGFKPGVSQLAWREGAGADRIYWRHA